MIKNSLSCIQKDTIIFQVFTVQFRATRPAHQNINIISQSGSIKKTKTKPTHNFSRIDFSLFFRRVVIFLQVGLYSSSGFSCCIVISNLSDLYGTQWRPLFFLSFLSHQGRPAATQKGQGWSGDGGLMAWSWGLPATLQKLH